MFDEIEISYHHIGLVLNKMNELYPFVCENSEISKIFYENTTLANIEKVKKAIYNHAPLPKANFPARIFENEKIQAANTTIIYFLKYLQLVSKQILKFKETNTSGAFKCNQLLTIRFCHLVVIFSKIVFFLSKFPTCSQIALVFYSNSMSKGNNDQLNTDSYTELINLVLLCTSDCETCISDCLRPDKYFIQNIISAISNPIIKFNNNCTFDQFSIYYSETGKTTTLPSLEYILMMNYSVIHDMCKIVFFVFDDLVMMYKPLARSIYLESNSIYLSSNILFTFNFEKYFRLLVQNQDLPTESIKLLLSQMEADSHNNHMQKIKYILFLLQDYLNFAQYDFDLIIENYIKLIALANYAIYEISTILTFNIDKDVNFILELLTTLTDLIDLTDSKNEDIKRFYLFNLATNDLFFLIEGLKQFQMLGSPSDELLPRFDIKSGDIKSTFLPIIYNQLLSMSESLKIIDLDKFDSGENYCFLPFNMNAGRTLFYYFRNMHNSTGEFVNQILEHLNTILLHIGFVENAFSSHCNFATLSNYSTYFVKKCEESNKISINNIATLIRIFDGLKKDKSISSDVRFLLFTDLAKLMRSPLSKIQSHYQNLLSKTSPFMNSSYTSTPRIANSFMRKSTYNQIKSMNAKIYELNLDYDKKIKQAELMNKNYEIYDFYNRINSMPFDKDDPILLRSILENQLIKELPIFAYHSYKNLRDVKEIQMNSVLEINKANFVLVEYFWHIFTILNLPFKRIMYNCRLNQSMLNSQSELLTQLHLYDEKEIGSLSIDNKLFVLYSNFLEDFIKGKSYNKVLYQTANNGFFPSKWMSSAALRNIINDFGPFMVLNLDIVLVKHIASCVTNIYENFLKNLPTVNSLYKAFRDASELPNINGIDSTIFPLCDEMIKLGSLVAIRRMLRSQSPRACEENVPGFLNSLAQTIMSSLNVLSAGLGDTTFLKDEEKMLIEIFGGSGGGSKNLLLWLDDEFFFVKLIIKKKDLQQPADFVAFCFYLSLFLFTARFNHIKLHPNLEAIDGNVHLFPLAMEALIQCGSVLFEVMDGNSTKYGLHIFFLMFAAVYRARSLGENFETDLNNDKEKQNVPIGETLNALQYLATIFPNYIKCLEYERIEEIFPLLEMGQILTETKKTRPLA